MWFVQVSEQLTVRPRNFVILVAGGNLLSQCLFQFDFYF